MRPAEQISNEDRILFKTVARAIITDSRGTLVDQVIWTVNRRGVAEASIPRLTPTRVYKKAPHAEATPRGDLLFSNGLGGFTPDGREYVITTDARPDDSGPVGECPGEPAVRDRYLGERARLHLDGQCP